MNTFLVYSNLDRFNTEPSELNWSWNIVMMQQVLFFIFSSSLLVRKKNSVLFHLVIPTLPALITVALAFLDFTIRGSIIRPTIVVSANSIVYTSIIIVNFLILKKLTHQKGESLLIDQN